MLTIITTLLFLFFLGFLVIHRQVMIAHFLAQDIKQNPTHQQPLKRMQLLGLRFDAKIVASLLLPPYLISVLLAAFSVSPTIISAVFFGLIFIFSFLLTALTLGNYFYYQTYHTYYDIFIFGLVEEDTNAVLKNIYDDYPVIKALLFTFIMAFIPSFLAFIVIRSQTEIAPHYGFSLLYVALSVLLIRGTIRSKPLSKIHAQVSSLSAINYMVPNGPIAFKWAVKEHKKNISFSAVDKMRGPQLLTHLFATDKLTLKTDKNAFLAANKPHVVFSLMESFGGNLLRFDDPVTNDLLGNLRPHFEQDFVFDHFTSSNNGTAASLFSISVHSTDQNISQSSDQKVQVPYGAFLTYKNQGYKTVFITSGNAMWRSVGTYFPQQAVDEIYDQNDIMDSYPEAKNTLSYWGVADEYSFALAKDLLEKSTQPLFIFVLTITNHPPYEAPKGYQPKTVNPDVLIDKIGQSETERRNILCAYQYAASALGDFITQIKHSALKNKTIIAATGDHHVRGVKYQMPTDLFYAYAVPFFISVPKAIQANLALRYDKNRFGSHKDVMPTLYSVSLSEVEYINLGGRNLLAQEDLPAYNFAQNSVLWADSTGVTDLSTQPYVKYTWHDGLTLGGETEMNDHERQHIAQYAELAKWNINRLIKGYKD
ncbi:LTA synthase family protein [[Pasteurella] aerogenes]